MRHAIPEKVKRRGRAGGKPSARLDFIFSASPMLRETFADIRALHPELFEADAMAQFLSLLLLLEKAQEKPNEHLPPKLNYRRMRDVLRHLREPRAATADALSLPRLSIKRLQWDEELPHYFNLAWKEATGQSLHRARFQLNLGSEKNRQLAQAMCRALMALGY